jgi:hypothetical protein
MSKLPQTDLPQTGLVLPDRVSPTSIPLLPIPAPIAPPITHTGSTGSCAGEGVESETGQKEKVGVEDARKEVAKERAQRKEATRKKKERITKKAEEKAAKAAKMSKQGAKAKAGAPSPEGEAKILAKPPKQNIEFGKPPRIASDRQKREGSL